MNLIYTAKNNAISEIIIKRSRFISKTFNVNSPNEVKPIIQQLKKENVGCRHIVYGFIIGDKNSQTCGMTDDGEPKGTAGRPVLEVLKGSNITNILVAVIRYFGGTKLGTGGLVKAYTESCQNVLKLLELKPLIKELELSIEIPYNLHESIKRTIIENKGKIIEEKFNKNISFTFSIPEEKSDIIKNSIKNISKGKIIL